MLITPKEPEEWQHMQRTLAFLVLAIFVPSLHAASDKQKTVDLFAKDLKSRDASTRADAAERLGELRYAEAVQPLIGALGDKDAGVRRAAASALWNASKVAQPAIPALRKALDDPDPAVVVRAAGALINMDVPAKEIADPLRNVLRAGDDVDRFLAARALIGVEPGERLVTPLVQYMRVNPRDKRRESYDAAAKALIELAKTQERAVIPRLAASLGESGDVAEPVLIALGEFKPRPDQWIETLLRYLKSPNPRLRTTAVDLVGEQNKSAAAVSAWAGPVGRLTTDSDTSVRHRSVWALQYGEGLAHDGFDGVLLVVAREGDKDIRERAAEAVGEIGDAEYPISGEIKKSMAQRALPVLTAALANDPEPRVRRNVIKSLNKLQLDADTVLPILAHAAVEQKDRDVRIQALQALRNRGKNAAPVADIIRPALDDPDPIVKTDVKAALEMMKSDRGWKTPVKTTAADDPAARERGLNVLRENKLAFTEDDFNRALYEQSMEKITAYLDAGMSPNLRFANSYGAPVLYEVLFGNPRCDAGTKAILKMMIARGANPKIADDRGNTPLMAAAEKCDAEVVKMMLAAGADMNAVNKSDTTAFEFALDRSNEAAAALAAAGFRLSKEKVKIYREAYKDKPKVLELVKRATK